MIVDLKSEGKNLVTRTDNLNRFYSDIRRYPTLSKEEERELFYKLRDGSKEEKKQAREKLFLCNQRLVMSYARLYASKDNMTDYISEGQFGLNNAIDNFDPDANNSFAAYAVWHLRAVFNRYAIINSSLVRKKNECKVYHLTAKATNDFAQLNERYPTPDELMEYINEKYSRSIRKEADLYDIKSESIDASYENDDKRGAKTLEDFNKETCSMNGFEETEKSDFEKEAISTLTEVLTDTEKKVITMLFGLVEENGVKKQYSIKEVAEKMDFSGERIRQIKIAAIFKMRREYEKKLKKYI